MTIAPGYVLIDNCNLENRERLMQQGYTYVVPDRSVAAGPELAVGDGSVTIYVKPVKIAAGEPVRPDAVPIIDLDGTGEMSYLADKGYLGGPLRQDYRQIDLRAAWELMRRGFSHLFLSFAYINGRDVEAVIPIPAGMVDGGEGIVLLEEYDREKREFKVLSCYFDSVPLLERE